MRYLNKIIFINSTGKSLPYAEIELNGNIHFIGTQGVGKSTLLRAILFFYNADTVKLGIPREKQRYNEYYFPFQNSYIIYEIATETGKFCILSFKTQGRVAFRFFNAAYDKKYFIDADGKAFESWDQIRAAFGTDVYSTRMITGYEEYRNIIYGNSRGLPAEFRKYALVESRQYQNIPRTISNVFLNAKLDAEFVKETIIKSLNEDEVKIDLDVYAQSHLKDFETHLNDIRKWTDVTSNGKNAVEEQANKVIKIYSSINFFEQQQHDLSQQLAHAIRWVQIQQPLVVDEVDRLNDKLQNIKNQIDNQEENFRKVRDGLQRKIGALDDKIQESRDKWKHYQAVNIEEIIKRVNDRRNILFQKEQIEEQLKLLTAKYGVIKNKYEALILQLGNQFQAFKNNKETEKHELRRAHFDFKERLDKEYEQVYIQIENQHAERVRTSEVAVNHLKEQQQNKRIALERLKLKRFYEEEITTTNGKTEESKRILNLAENIIEKSRGKMLNISREAELERNSIENDYQINKGKIDNGLDEIVKQIGTLQQKLQQSEGSFYEWLSQNVPEWKERVGKVIDEDNVLFSRGLNPRKVDATEESFFGIQIDVQKINKKVRTLEDLNDELDELKKKNEGYIAKQTELSKEKESDLNKLQNRFQPKIRTLKQLIQENEYKAEQQKRLIEKLGVELYELREKAEKEKQISLLTLEGELNQLNEKLLQGEDEFAKAKNRLAKDLRTHKKEKEDKIAEESQVLEESLQSIEYAIQTSEEKAHVQKAELQRQLNGELEGKGADITQIKTLEIKKKELEGELSFIENHRDRVAEFNKDKRELFDREDEFSSERLLAKRELETERQKFEQQKNVSLLKQGELSGKKQILQKQSIDFEADLQAYQQFSKTEVFGALEKWMDVPPTDDKPQETCRDIISEINKGDGTLVKRNMELQSAVNKFTGNFQEDNLFHFKVRFQDKEDYFEFSEMLKEFIEEEKIGEYKKRIEERFANIIHQIGKETNTLISKEGEIGQVVREINNDFVARNFVGAIKSMELKTTESTNKIFRILIEIKNFNEENNLNLGEPTLFSTGDLSQKNEKAISLLRDLVREIALGRTREISLSDSFELLFKIVENDNDTGWVERLTNVGSEGTDVLAKAMINIMLLNVFKEKISKRGKHSFSLHCMMDEIGKLHPNNVKGILKFANDRNIMLINSSPTSYNAADYRYTYLLTRNDKNMTVVRQLVRKITPILQKDTN